MSHVARARSRLNEISKYFDDRGIIIKKEEIQKPGGYRYTLIHNGSDIGESYFVVADDSITFMNVEVRKTGYYLGVLLHAYIFLEFYLNQGIQMVHLDDMSDNYRQPNNWNYLLGLQYDSDDGPEMTGTISKLLDQDLHFIVNKSRAKVFSFGRDTKYLRSI